jgi:hypothetical protein
MLAHKSFEKFPDNELDVTTIYTNAGMREVITVHELGRTPKAHSLCVPPPQAASRVPAHIPCFKRQSLEHLLSWTASPQASNCS